MVLPVFAITLFVSAFLLFLVQPMIGKMILPNLGGTPQVWNTCMVFFQTVLLAGYAYTHTVSTRLRLRTQFLVHAVLLVLPLALFGLFLASAAGGPDGINGGTFRGITKDWIPPAGGNPIFATLWLLTMVVGLPFFVVSTSAPLLQRWFAYSGHPTAHDPYFLYGASNFGSMLSLIAYPFVVERILGLYEQSWMWMVGYAALVGLFVVCVGFLWKVPGHVEVELSGEEKAAAAQKEEGKETGIQAAEEKTGIKQGKIRKGSKQKGKKKSAEATGITKKPTSKRVQPVYEEIRSDVMTPWRRLRWVLLAFVPSSLMLGITTYISTDVSPIPLFWVIPLALYLLSFILVFSKWPVVWTRQPHTLMAVAQPVVLLFFIFLLTTEQIRPIYRSITFSIFAFFLTAMVCHGELARDRPGTKNLTEFYLWLSVGGMLGGVFNALLAPVLFWGLAELPIALIAACFMRPYANRLAPVDRPIVVVFGGVLGLIFGLLLLGTWNPLLGPLFGAVVGGLFASAFTFEPTSDGWTEKTLIGMFPDLGDWAHKKGQELRSEIAKDESERKKGKRALAVRQDYYVLSYALDVALPVLLVLYMLFAASITPDPMFIQETKKSWLFDFVTDTLGVSNKANVPVSQNPAYALASGLVTALRFGIPIVIALMFASRPIRVGLAVLAIFGVGAMWDANRDVKGGKLYLHQTRTYFGRLQVLGEDDYPVGTFKGEAIYLEPGNYDPQTGGPAPYTYLMHGTTHHGLNYQSPKKLRRLATTYYHRKGPVGVIMERFNWFPGPQHTYWADNRMPAAMAAMGAGPLNFGLIPDVQLVNLWSEPPYACVGLGTGTMASYARPLQHMTFYEIDNQIRLYSVGTYKLPAKLFAGDSPQPEPQEGPYFNYVHDAIARGAVVEIMMGDARISMKRRTEAIREEQRLQGEFKDWEKWREGIAVQHREQYYYAIELDAFSSDAIPIHLITKEAVEQYLDKLAPEGVILVHTSNRHVQLPLPVMDIANALGLEYRVVNCFGREGGSGERGHFQSEYVMLSRSFEQVAEIYAKRAGKTLSSSQLRAEAERLRSESLARWQARLKQLEASRGMDGKLKEELRKVWARDTYVPNVFQERGSYQRWQRPSPPGNRIWTDDYSDFIRVFDWGFRH